MSFPFCVFFRHLISTDTPLKREWSLTERPEHLRLWGGPYNLQSLESPTLLLRKQTRSTGIWSTRLHFDPNRPTCEAGTVLYWNLYTFASIGVRASLGGGREIWFTQPGDQGPGTFKVYDLLKTTARVSTDNGCSIPFNLYPLTVQWI